MRVYKFGGASVRNADSVRNLGSIVVKATEPIVVIVSAMGQMTNDLERLVSNSAKYQRVHDSSLQIVIDFHREVCMDLLSDVPIEIEQLLEELILAAGGYERDPMIYYDDVVAFGELLSTRIIALWLSQKVPVEWLDARDLIVTDEQHRSANVLWSDTRKKLQSTIGDAGVFMTQGFIGGTKRGMTTTLGREGSDFSAAVVASCLGASDVTVWKDVPGIMNADPKTFPEAQKIAQLSYDEVTEMAYYGAKVIHPKTLSPLAGSGIPLHVRSFIDPEGAGSQITDERMPTDIPCFLFRHHQILVSLRSRGSALLSERKLQELLEALRSLGIHTNIFQHSALSFSFCFDTQPGHVQELQSYCRERFDMWYNEGLHLATVKHATDEAVSLLPQMEVKFLEQTSRSTYQVLYKPLNDTF